MGSGLVDPHIAIKEGLLVGKYSQYLKEYFRKNVKAPLSAGWEDGVEVFRERSMAEHRTHAVVDQPFWSGSTEPRHIHWERRCSKCVFARQSAMCEKIEESYFFPGLLLKVKRPVERVPHCMLDIGNIIGAYSIDGGDSLTREYFLRNGAMLDVRMCGIQDIIKDIMGWKPDNASQIPYEPAPRAYARHVISMDEMPDCAHCTTMCDLPSYRTVMSLGNNGKMAQQLDQVETKRGKVIMLDKGEQNNPAVSMITGEVVKSTRKMDEKGRYGCPYSGAKVTYLWCDPVREGLTRLDGKWTCFSWVNRAIILGKSKYPITVPRIETFSNVLTQVIDQQRDVGYRLLYLENFVQNLRNSIEEKSLKRLNASKHTMRWLEENIALRRMKWQKEQLLKLSVSQQNWKKSDDQENSQTSETSETQSGD